MNRSRSASVPHIALTWLLVLLIAEPHTNVLGQPVSPYVRALEVILAPSPPNRPEAPSARQISLHGQAGGKEMLLAQSQMPTPVPFAGKNRRGVAAPPAIQTVPSTIEPPPQPASLAPSPLPPDRIVLSAAGVETNLLLTLARTPVTLTNGSQIIALSFFSDSNHNYVVEFRDDLGLDLCNNWQPLTNAPHNYGIVFTEANVTNRFYRLRRVDIPRSPIFALLANDTGTNSLDGLTSDPTIMGMALRFPEGTLLQGSLDQPDGPFVSITNLGAPRHFVVTREHLSLIQAAPLADGAHTLHLRADNAGQTLATFALPFTLDTAPPAVSVALAAAFDSPPLGDGRTTTNPVTLAGQTEPGARLELLAPTLSTPGGRSGWVIHTIVPDESGTFALTNVVLAEGTNQFYFRALDAACNETNTLVQVVLSVGDCTFSDARDGWLKSVSPTAGIPGTVSMALDNGCAAVLTEGDSFLVTLSKEFVVPTLPSTLNVTYSQPAFDTATTNAMRDAFEIALVDATGRSLTYTIQGTNGVSSASAATLPNLPPSPDALFNHSDGLTPFHAPGTAPSQLPNGQMQVAVDVSHLAPGSTAKLILRLVNNDRDHVTSVRILDVRFKPNAPGISFAGSPTAALSLIARISSTFFAPRPQTAAPCSQLPGIVANGPKVVQSTTASANRTVSIDFENFPDGTLLREQLAPIGVRVSGAGGYSGYVFLIGEFSVDPFENSGTHIMHAGWYGEPTTFTFTDPQNPTNIIGTTGVSFLMGDGDPDLETFSVAFYGVAGDLLSEPTVYSTTTNGLRISATSEALGALIGSVTVTLLLSSPTGVTLDDFTFTSLAVRPVGPTLGIVSPADNARLAPNAALLTGYALPDRPDIHGTPATNRIALVAINGSPVDALDAAGNFFSAIDVNPGQNVFEVVATDTFNQSTTNTITVYGATCPQNFSSLGEASASVVPEYGRTSFNEWTRVVYADLALRNIGTYPVGAPFYVGITHISDPTVRLLSPDGVSADGIPYYDYSEALINSSLPILHSSLARAVAFHNPNKVQFTYELVVLGQLNQSPHFTTTPPLEVISDRVYTYASHAIDPDGDVLRYSLLESPASMTIDATNGFIRWTATNALGNYRIRLQADDERGGLAEQSYVLSVVAPPSNRPPYFVTTPVSAAKVSSDRIVETNTFELSRWQVLQYEYGIQGPAQWVFSSNNTVANQIINADPSILLSDVPVDNGVIEGSLKVTTDFDYDYIGFVFGFQDIGHFYLFDWRQLDHASYGVIAQQGMHVKVVSANSPLEAGELYASYSVNSNRVRTLYHNDIPWEDYTNYQFALNFTAGKFAITVKKDSVVLATIALADNTYPDGKFGFYNFSQGEVLYQGFNYQSHSAPSYSYDARAVDPDGDRLRYSLITAPTGMTINQGTGSIRWAPAADQVGTHEVTVFVDDGRGGFNTQAYVVCVLPDENPVFVRIPAELTIEAVDKSGLRFDGQALTAEGIASAIISNRGPDDIRVPFDVTFFEDRNTNGLFDPAIDNVLGKTLVSNGLAAGKSLPVSAPVSGTVQFAGPPLWAFVDSGRNILEPDENNNTARDACEAAPPVGQFNPLVKWHADTFTYQPLARMVMMAPVVIDLDGDGTPEVIASFFGHGGFDGGHGVGILRALSGQDGHEIWFADDGIEAYAGLAAGDIDGDGRPEIIGIDGAHRLVAHGHDGSLKWRSSVLGSFGNLGYPSLADLNHDGVPEVVIGNMAFDNGGNKLWDGTERGGFGRGDSGTGGPLSVVADIDLDGSPEVVAGSSAYRADGSVYWNARLQNGNLIPDGAVAIGNFDEDPQAEIVLVSDAVYMLEHDGRIKWGPVPIPGAGFLGRGGAPTIADVDGDGRPDIGVAAARYYTVFNADGSIKWITPDRLIRDESSYTTGSSVFDFDGDGKAEVVYGDEYFLRIFRGLDGQVLYETHKSSGTVYELPVIADVDGDGRADIIAVANNYAIGPETGIYAYTDANNTWVSTRKIWNQHSYHIDNINDDGTIPRYETNSWLSHNTYRLNALPTRSATLAAPDLVPSLMRVTVSNTMAIFTVRIGNGGVALVTPGLNVAFYNGNPRTGGSFLGKTQTLNRLSAGTFEDVSLTLPANLVSDLWVAADDDGAGNGRETECNEANNVYHPNIPPPSINRLPEFTSIPVTNATESQIYRYDARAQDADSGDSLTFSLVLAPLGMSVDARTGAITWSPNESQNGRQWVAVAVTDSRGARNFQSFSIWVQDAANASPFFVSTPPVSTFATQQLVYEPAARDADGDSLNFDLIVAPAGVTLDTNTGAVIWRPSYAQLGAHDLVLRVQDGRGGVALQSWQITVVASNSPPFITTSPPGPAVVELPYRYLVRAQDAGGQPLTFFLGSNAPPGVLLTPGLSMTNSAVLAWTPALSNLGPNAIEIAVQDSEGAVARQSFSLEVVASALNRPPTITSSPRTQARVGGAYAYVIEVTDRDGDPVTVDFVSGPAGMVVTSPPELGFQRSLLYWPATEFGTHVVRLRASDGRNGITEQQFTLTVSSSLSNQPPFITSHPVEHATSGQIYDYQLEARDPDGDVVAWRLATGPVGMSLDSVTGRLLWTPTLDQLGTNTVIVEATDALFLTATQAFDIDVGCLNRPPHITSTPPTAAQIGTEYLYAPRGSDPDEDRLAWSLVPGQFPIGMTIDGTNGLIRWNPTTNQIGSAIVSVKLSDGRGGNDTQTYTLYASDLRANKSPIIVSTPARGATVGRPYSYSLRATDPDGDALTLSSLVALPAGATFAPSAAGEGLLLWTPTPEQIGPQQFIFTARDPAGASASQRYFVTVRANQPPVITSLPRTNAVPGVTYRYDVIASDPDGDALTYAFTSPVPAGMTIDSLGRVIWMPNPGQTGVVAVSLSASDGFGGAATQAFLINVSADTEPPQVSLTLVQGAIDPATGQWAGDLGDTVRVRVDASDNVGVAARALNLGTKSYPLDAAFVASIPVERDGLFNLTGTAVDFAGNSNSTVRTILFRDPRATNQIFVQIHTPTNGARLTGLAPVRATITNAVDIIGWSWGYALASAVNLSSVVISDLAFTILGATNLPRGIRSMEDIFVGTFDPTTLQNDAYVIAVAATDVNGNTWTEPVLISVEGNLKFGEFRIEFTDLAIPVAGIPITITRVYDTRDARRVGDFGHGWSLGVQDAKIRKTLVDNGWGPTMFPGSRVYVTKPDGQRVGFSAYVERQSCFAFCFADVGLRPDAGVYDKLAIVDNSATYYGGMFLGGLADSPYSPTAFRLTTKDGTIYSYEENVGLTNVTDLNGNHLEYTRDGIFHYNAGSSTADQSVRFVRDARGRISQIIDPNGKALTYSYDTSGDLRSFSDQVTNTTRYLYSASRSHYLTNIVDPLGRSALRPEYDSVGRLKTVRDANGNPISQDFDPTTKAATFTDGNGTVIHTRFDDNGNEIYRRIDGVYTNTFAYDANNNLLASTNGRGFSTNFTYDTRGNVTAIRDSLGNRTTIAYDDRNKPVGVTNALGQVLNLSYNSSGQLTQVVNNAGFKTTVTRDAQGRVVSLTDATETNSTVFDYSNGCACGRPGKVINPDGSFRLYEYNLQGLTNRIVNELGAETLFHHDDSGKLLWMRDPLTNFTQFFYNGPLLTNIVDALGRSTFYEYDSLNRTNRIIDAEGGVVEFRYDSNGNRTKVIDPVGNETTFVYDAGNRLVQQIDPLGHTNFFAYDAAGNRTEAIDRNGHKRTFAFDAANRMTNELWWEGTNVVRSIIFGFNELGVQTLAADPAARYEYSYDALNRLERVLSQSAGAPDFTLLYTYTALGQVASVTDNWGVRVGSGYDNRNRLASRTWSPTVPGVGIDPARVDFSYDASGNRVRTDRFADLAGTTRIGFTTNAYNHAGIVTNITHIGPASQVLAKYDYNFDAAYQIRQWTINNQLSDFAYDRTGQLTNALNTARANENFRFDANGNRVGTQSGGSYVVGGNNQILSDGTNGYTYDYEGNMTSRSNTVIGVLTTYKFDHRNRLVNVLDRNPGGVVTQTVAFVYDAMNRRLAKTVSGPQSTNVVRFLYNQDDSWADLDGANAVIARYLHGARIDELLARSRASYERGWYLTDHLGTVRDLANATGALVAHVDYSSFGQVLSVRNPAAVDRFLFTGREYDSAIGFYFYRARYFSSDLGRFVSEDPIGLSSSDFNIYRYIHNSPATTGDPTGNDDLLSGAYLRSVLLLRRHAFLVFTASVVTKFYCAAAVLGLAEIPLGVGVDGAFQYFFFGILCIARPI